MSGDLALPTEFPEWGRWGQREGFVIPEQARGPNGRRLCKWCRTEVKPPRRKWCGSKCTKAYGWVWSWGALRDYVKVRDNKTCQICGTTDPPKPEQPRSGWGRYDPWDIDHIKRVVDGGTDDPANLRLLCIPCHNEAGYEQRGTAKPEEPEPTTQMQLFDVDAA